MKASLTFALPQERAAFDAAVHGEAWRLVVEDMRQYIRAALKHDDWRGQPRPETPEAALEWVRAQIVDAADARGVWLD